MFAVPGAAGFADELGEGRILDDTDADAVREVEMVAAALALALVLALAATLLVGDIVRVMEGVMEKEPARSNARLVLETT